MGRVFEARDSKLNRTVAIKQMYNDVADDRELRDHILDEARLAAAVSHPNIVATYSVHDSADPPYFVMEFVDGPTLSDLLIWQGRFDVDATTRILLQISDALQAAHSRRIVHCDIKPANILLSKDQRFCRVADFGIARSATETLLDEPGRFLGTPHYMSPEQFEGHLVDSSTDQFSLGVIAYQMITGELPFNGSTFSELKEAICESNPSPIAKYRSDIPFWLVDLTNRLLQKGATRRPTAAETFEILSRNSEEKSNDRSRKNVRSYVGYAAILLAILIGGWRLLPTSQPTPNEHLNAKDATGDITFQEFELTDRLLAQGEPPVVANVGSSIVIADNWAAIGATDAYSTKAQTGKVYVLKRDPNKSDGGWNDHSTLSPNSMFPIKFGSSLAMGDDILLVGASDDHSPILNAGSVYVYHLENDVWTLETHLKLPKVVKNAQFGASIAVNREMIVVGAPEGGSTYGKVYTYRRKNGTWTLDNTLLPPPGSGLRRFGCSVCFVEDSLIVGDSRGDAPGEGTGALHVFDQVDGRWTLRQTLGAETKRKTKWFGQSLAYDNNRLFVSAFDYSANTEFVELNLYMFRLENNTWKLAEEIGTDLVVDTTQVNREFLEADVCIAASADNLGISVVVDTEESSQRASCFLELREGIWKQTDNRDTLSDNPITSIAMNRTDTFVGHVSVAENPEAGTVTQSWKNSNGEWNSRSWRAPKENAALIQTYLGFGVDMAVAGDYAFFSGGGKSSSLAAGHGSVFIFRRNSNKDRWSYDSTILSPSPIPNGNFGYRLATSGNRFVTVEVADRNQIPFRGNLHVFERRGSRWDVQQSLLNIETGGNYCLAMDKNTIAIGRYLEGSMGIENWPPGNVAIFEFVDGAWSQTQHIELPGTTTNDHFGCSIALRNNLLAIGVKAGYDNWHVGSGRVLLYNREGGTFRPLQELEAASPTDGDRFGKSVAISENWIAVGAQGAETNGTVTLFRPNGEQWIEHQVIKCPDQNEINFGYDVSLDERFLVIGRIPHYDLDMDVNGSAYVYRLDGDTWKFHQKLQTPEPYYGHYSGSTVLLDNETVFYSSSAEDESSAAVYQFQLPNGRSN